MDLETQVQSMLNNDALLLTGAVFLNTEISIAVDSLWGKYDPQIKDFALSCLEFAGYIGAIPQAIYEDASDYIIGRFEKPSKKS